MGGAEMVKVVKRYYIVVPACRCFSCT